MESDSLTSVEYSSTVSCHVAGMTIKLLSVHQLTGSLQRCFSTSDKKAVLHKCLLKNRAVVKVEGSEASEFLQGLVTNDVKHLDEQNLKLPSIFCMFLNTQGRVLFDTFIMKKDPSTYLIDCDHQLSEKLVKHLKIFKVKRKIDISVSPCSIGAIFDSDEPLEKIPEEFKDNDHYKDTRLKNLGFRVISSSLENFVQSDDSYRKLRYQLGICEGLDEVQSGKVTPLEFNLDYMHGVSFHKGCYLGQELTARTHHTGVIRKRVVPLSLSSHLESINSNEDVLDENGKKVGKVIGHLGSSAIGLLRLEQCEAAQQLFVCGVEAKYQIPQWWPAKAPKTPQNKIHN